MKERSLDFFSRRAVRATILVSIDADERLVSSRLPEGYLLDNGTFRFPAGYWESYFVNGKEYNVEGDRTSEEQRERIAKDLSEEGFGQEEIREFIEEIETREDRPMLLSLDASNKWLGYHPEFEREALRLLREIKNEASKELVRGMKKN